MLKTILLETFVGSNELYTLWRSFVESFKITAFLFSTLLIPSTWPQGILTCKTGLGRAYLCWLSVLFDCVFSLIVGSNQLYEGWRSFPVSLTFFFSCIKLIEHRHYRASLKAICGDIEGINKVKNKNKNFSKLLGNDLQPS